MQFCRGTLSLVLALIGLVMTGCVSAHKLDQALAIPVGMNEVQVANKVGQPVVKDRTADGAERWIWSREGQFGLESVTLVMRNGRVAAVESEGERLKHLEQIRALDALLAGTAPATNALVGRPAVVESGWVANQPAANTNALVVVKTETAQPEVKREKSSEEILRERDEALAAARREAREVEEMLRAAEKPTSPPAVQEPAPSITPPQELPSLTAWYMARQFVSERLAPGRCIFPNPRFASEVAGEERMEGNVWRTWGYVDTVDSSNAPRRRQWTAELEFQGGTKWKLRDIAFGEK